MAMKAPDFDQLQIELRAMRATIPIRVEVEQMEAEVIRAKFNALVKQGFTEDQAIQLCRKSP